ncbi:hypothetical protein [Providencia rettgeri]|uniref:hypothetical protein n=1 Tax=Providencia rettgeri TaxID=587 RepID=UPI001BAB9775|nr:hypothetical protein [Providencia rettgeri]MBS0858409.1 hypothetical protein [Providencia rettgeri]MBS0872148.1 hypothetical protein [Providencia rettgeri]MBS0919294.1 hypothetical protein [Providencia rettgeri]
MSSDKKNINKSSNFSQQIEQISEGRELSSSGFQSLADGFMVRTPLSAPGNTTLGRQVSPINLAPSNFQTPKAPKIPAKKS